jgi:hypothetical protein
MQKVEYDHSSLTQSNLGRMAIIDSGNSSIQIPASEFAILKQKMMK